MSEEQYSRVPLLDLNGISKKFAGTTVLQGVDFDVWPGEVHALMGENGAGKSTMMKIVGGVHQPDTGTIRIAGRERVLASPAGAMEAGVAMIHQELSAVPYLQVAENLALGNEPTKLPWVVDRTALNQQAQQKLDRIGVKVDPRSRMSDLSVGQQQMVEIARAVDQDAKILILDEPTASLSETESERLFALVEKMRSDGMGLIYISHRLDEVWRLADRITVLRDGHLVQTSVRGEVDQDEVVRQMVGRRIESLYVRDNRKAGDVVLEVSELTSRQSGVGPVSFTVKSGEVVTLVGLIGAGRTETVRLIYGADVADSGSIRLRGRAARIRSVTDALGNGVALLPESRKEQALFPSRNIIDNITISSLKNKSRAGVLVRSLLNKVTQKYMSQLRIRASSAKQTVGTLSGGNQQKVVLSRLLESDTDLLILDEPTRGVDVGAKHDIYEIINSLASAGKAILIVSSDLPEALGISDRLLVYRDGMLVQELAAEGSSEEEVMMFATGLTKK